MRLLADTHGHLGARHDARRLLHGARDRLNVLARASGAQDYRLILCLLDRAGAPGLDALSASAHRDGFESVPCPADPEAVRIRFPDGEPDLWVCAGRQVATAERLELLILGRRPAVPDGLSLRETLAALRDSGAGVLILPWGFGKWTGRRAGLLRALLAEAPPDSLLLGDSSLRPRGFPEDRLLALGRSRGFRITAGSDPLPPAGEESSAGTYASEFDADWEDERPVISLVRALADPRIPLETAGCRSAPWTVLRRLARNARG